MVRQAAASRAVVLKLQHISELPSRLVITRIAGPHLRVSAFSISEVQLKNLYFQQIIDMVLVMD